MDELFIRRSYRSISLAWITAITWAVAFGRPWIALSITLGALLGTAILASNSWFFSRALRREMPKPARRLARVWLLRYPMMAGLLYLILRWQQIDVFALCGGVVLVHLAIVLKALGAMLTVKRS